LKLRRINKNSKNYSKKQKKNVVHKNVVRKNLDQNNIDQNNIDQSYALRRNIKKKNAQKKKMKRKKRLIRTLKFLIFVALLSGIFYLMTTLQMFNITKIEVYGNSKIKSQDIISATNIYIGGNGFKHATKDFNTGILLRYGDEENRILKSFSYVKTAIVRYKPPKKVRIDIVERKATYYLKYLQSYLLIDADGVVLEDSMRPFAKFPLAEGIEVDSYNVGQVIKSDRMIALERIKTLMSEINKNDETNKSKFKPLLTSIDVSELFNIKITLDSRIKADIGDLKDTEYRLNFLRDIYFSKLGKDEKGKLEFNENQKYDFKSIEENEQ